MPRAEFEAAAKSWLRSLSEQRLTASPTSSSKRAGPGCDRCGGESHPSCCSTKGRSDPHHFALLRAAAGCTQDAADIYAELPDGSRAFTASATPERAASFLPNWPTSRASLAGCARDRQRLLSALRRHQSDLANCSQATTLAIPRSSGRIHAPVDGAESIWVTPAARPAGASRVPTFEATGRANAKRASRAGSAWTPWSRPCPSGEPTTNELAGSG